MVFIDLTPVVRTSDVGGNTKEDKRIKKKNGNAIIYNRSIVTMAVSSHGPECNLECFLVSRGSGSAHRVERC